MQSDVNTDEEEAGLYKVEELMNELLGERYYEERGAGGRGIGNNGTRVRQEHREVRIRVASSSCDADTPPTTAATELTPSSATASATVETR